MADQGNITYHQNSAFLGMNMDNVPSQVNKGLVTYALNAAIENFDANSIEYQNELGNELCINFPDSYILIGLHYIPEKKKHIFFLSNPIDINSQIGYMENNDCIYHVLIEDPCLNFNINHPIHKAVHKITNCTTEIYWTDFFNPRRWLDIDNIENFRKLKYGTPLCDPVYSDEIDCNKLRVQPDFEMPLIEVKEVIDTGNIKAGVYQFAVQYSDATGNPFTSYYSITNPVPIFDETIVTLDFNFPVNKAIIINVFNLDTTGLYTFFNVAVIRTVNGISSPELLGTYSIETDNRQITYTGESVSNIRLSMDDIFEKFPYYELANDISTAQDILLWTDLGSNDRVNYQNIANEIKLQWETWRIPATESYADEVNATNLRGYLRDEIYAFEISFILSNGRETDGFHIPGREITGLEKGLPDIAETDDNFVGTPSFYAGGVGYSPWWKIYNTASVEDTYIDYDPTDVNYKGHYQYGKFGYWESIEEYPCNTDIWGKLAGQKIRHHRFPDVSVSPIFESKIFVDRESMEMGNDAVFPIGVKISPEYIQGLISVSNLTDEQKNDIVGFRILRGDRSTNKSIVAKGMLRNVNTYLRDSKEYYYPNYPYNDLREDPFLNYSNNAYTEVCDSFDIEITKLFYDPNRKLDCALLQYVDCSTNKFGTILYTELKTDKICAIGKPVFLLGQGTVSYTNYDEYKIWHSGLNGDTCAGWRVEYNDRTEGIKPHWISGPSLTQDGEAFHIDVKVVVGTVPECIEYCNRPEIWCGYDYHKILKTGEYRDKENTCSNISKPIPPVVDEYRQVFNSPETSFGRPFLGDILKVEGVIFGKGQAHFTEVKDNAKYKLISEEAQKKALDSSAKLGGITKEFDTSAMMSAYEAYLKIFLQSIPNKNYAYSFNSIANYDYLKVPVDAEDIIQRNLDIARYLIPVVAYLGDDKDINNWERESSVYLKTDTDKASIPFPSRHPTMLMGSNSILTEKSRFTISEAGNCNNPATIEPIEVVSYYASLKSDNISQWGQIYTYETINTGFVHIFNKSVNTTIFGGDTFISRFAFKTKLPFFIDNRVNAPDGSDVFYDEIGNIGYPKYWHSARSILKDYTVAPYESNRSPGTLVNFISYKAHNFDCPDNTSVTVEASTGTTTTSTTIMGTTTTTTSSNFNDFKEGTVSNGDYEVSFYDGYFYVFAYGVPNFYCETSYNIDLRQAFNKREGDFWPHVSSTIPDDWFQEKYTPIEYDNTYYYNVSYSKQNKEGYYSHLPPDWSDNTCYTFYPWRTIYSDPQNKDEDNRVNAWRIYRAVSYYDFPQNFGRLTSLDGIQNSAILARFENKTLLYNNLLTMDTSYPQAVYMGNSKMFSNPPIDFAETDIGYAGSQHKMLLKVPYGQISADAKRGNVFLIQGTQANDITAFGSGMNRFFTDHLQFQILKYFPNVYTDNHFKGIGLHAVFDSKFERLILTKLDYAPLDDRIGYDEETYEFYIEEEIGEYLKRTTISVYDTKYFCNKSWTLSYNFNTKSWISFHSYLPNFYIPEVNMFYSGLNDCCDDFDFIAAELPSNFDCMLWGYAVCEGSLPDCRLEGEVYELCTTTTTTTTELVPSTTTTTTSTLYPPCILLGEAEALCPTTTTTTTLAALDCRLEGEAQLCPFPTTSTTTTLRPSTTTTTTTSSPTTTTTTTPYITTTTTTTLDCRLEGTAQLCPFPPTTTTTTTLDCRLEGTAQLCPFPTTTTTTTATPPTTSTTTTCRIVANLTRIACIDCMLEGEAFAPCCELQGDVWRFCECILIGEVYRVEYATTTTSTTTIEVTTTTTTIIPTTTTTTSTTTEEVTTTSTTTTIEESTTTTTTEYIPTTTTTTTTTNPISFEVEFIDHVCVQEYDGTTTTTTTLYPPTTTTTTTNDDGEVWEAEFKDHVCVEVECDLEYEITEITFDNSFFTEWTVEEGDKSITLPLNDGNGSAFNFVVYWDENDLSIHDHITAYNDPLITHTYPSAGTYVVAITGQCEGWSFNNGGDKLKILRAWGGDGFVWKYLESAFSGCSNLTEADIPNWDVSGVNSLNNLFNYAILVLPIVTNWDTSNVLSMQAVFQHAETANPDVRSWDVSSVTTMEFMFAYAYTANPDVSIWDVSNVENMAWLFAEATSANPDVSIWDTSSVINMAYLFRGAIIATPDTTTWNTANVETMTFMFYGATLANPITATIGNIWNVSKVTDMSYMFLGTTNANPDVSNWNVSAVLDMTCMFSCAIIANPDVSGWDVSNVINMFQMFDGATLANPDTSSWDTSSITNMSFIHSGNVSLVRIAVDSVYWTNPSVLTHVNAFYGALNVANYADIPCDWKGVACTTTTTTSP